MHLFVLGNKMIVLCKNMESKKPFEGNEWPFDGVCPYGDLFRTPHKGKTSRQYYALNDNFELENRQVSLVLPISFYQKLQYQLYAG